MVTYIYSLMNIVIYLVYKACLLPVALTNAFRNSEVFLFYIFPHLITMACRGRLMSAVTAMGSLNEVFVTPPLRNF